jgi:glycosyltransferase involved in cell wall biosynthesis
MSSNMLLQPCAPIAPAVVPSTARGRILLLSTDMGMGGGAEEQVIHLAVSLHRRGWTTRIVSMLPPSPMPPDFDYSAIPVDHLGLRRGIPDPRSIFRFAAILRKFQPDVVHSHMNHANLLARAARLISPTPVVLGTLHALNMAGVDRDHTRLFELAHRWTDFLSEETTAICHAAADYYRQHRAVPPSKIRVVPNAIDTDRYSFNAQARAEIRSELQLGDQFTWLAVGRLELVKAYPTLLRAFAKLDRAVAGSLLICGEGSVRSELKTLAADLGILPRVRFLGLRKDIPRVLSAADAFTLSSDSEGLPLVLLQAAAAGLPIVATNVGGNAEVVVDGCNGRLVPAGDPERFAHAMAQILALSPEARRAMGESGRVRVQSTFQTTSVVDRWEQIYAELLNRTRKDDFYQPRRWASRAQSKAEPRPLVWSSTKQFRTGEA